MTTLIGLYDRADQAQKVVNEIGQSGIQSHQAEVLNKDRAGQDQNAIKGRLVNGGMPENMAQVCAQAISRGETILLLDAPEEKADDALDIMRRNGAKKFHELEALMQEAAHEEHREQASRSHEEGRERIPVVEEQVSIGKRKVMRGGYRLVTTVSERPVEETVRLREERVDVQRDKVDRSLSPEEAERAFQEKTVEMRETAEEAEVRKQARVVEEVSLKRTASEHEEKVQDTARRTDVKVEKTGR